MIRQIIIIVEAWLEDSKGHFAESWPMQLGKYSSTWANCKGHTWHVSDIVWYWSKSSRQNGSLV